MSIISILALIVLTLIALNTYKTQVLKTEPNEKSIGYIKSVGLLALVIGVLAQLIGLYSAFSAIEQMGQISAPMLAGGLKVSSITTLYGLFVFIIGYIAWLLLRLKK